MHRLKSIITLLDRFAIFLVYFPPKANTCSFLSCVSVFASSYVPVVVLDVLLLSSVLDELVLVLDEPLLLSLLLVLVLEESEELSLSEGSSFFGLPFRLFLFLFFFFILTLSILLYV